MNQRAVAAVIIGAVVLFLLVAAIVAGLVIGGVIGAVTDREGLQVLTEQPTTTDELRDSYDLETGALEVNLEDLNLPEGTTDVEANVDTGALTVVVPRGVAVQAEAEVGDGALSILGQDLTGENVQRAYESEDYDQADRKLSLELSVGTGVISVVREE